jgi:hypothetical protein
MDYSLLLGIDEASDRIVVGIIDYVRKCAARATHRTRTRAHALAAETRGAGTPWTSGSSRSRSRAFRASSRAMEGALGSGQHAHASAASCVPAAGRR